MTIRRLVVTLLDRPGTRTILALVATAYACWLNRGYVLRVFFDRATGSWGRAALGEVIIDGRRFDYHAHDLKLADGRTPWTQLAHRYWLDRAHVRAGETVFDIGAEVGSDVHAFSAAVGPTGLVIAIEAHPKTFASLQRTVALSGFENVICLPLAVTSAAAIVHISDGDTTLSSTLSERGHAVPGLPLDAIAASQGLGDVGLVKLNIEGSESAALQGMREVLSRARQVIVACHDFRADRGESPSYRTRDDVIRALAAAGFVVEPMRDGVPDYQRDHVVAQRLHADASGGTGSS